jgi:Haem-binding domain
MKKYFKIGLLVLLGILIVMQFFRPKKNIDKNVQANNITKVAAIPAEVNAIFQKACYDCHSNNTVYPWYAEVMPVGWFLNNHIKEGKREINFDEFASYKPRRALKKLHEIEEQITENKMPLDSYIKIHKNAKLTDAEKKLVMDWATSTSEALKVKYNDTLKVN